MCLKIETDTCTQLEKLSSVNGTECAEAEKAPVIDLITLGHLKLLETSAIYFLVVVKAKCFSKLAA